MSQNQKSPKVDTFLKKAPKWAEEMAQLREIALGCGLNEQLKWGKPCYDLDGSNVAIIIPFKESCALMFTKGALLKDPKGVLGRPGENTQAGRWIKFTTVKEVRKMTPVVKAYLKEALAAEKAGLKVAYKKTSDYPVPPELKARLANNRALQSAFSALTPGRQRGYLLHFSSAKQAQTRDARIDKCTPRILAGKGLNDD